MSKKHSYEFIKGHFEKEGYKLLSNEYINSKTKLLYNCPNRHEHKISWDEWSHLGNRCPYCTNKAKKTLIDIDSSFTQEGYILISNNYINNRQKLFYKCPIGHIHSVSWDGWRAGNRCPECKNTLKYTIEKVKNIFNDDGYILLSEEYVNNKTKLKYKCPEGHINHTRLNDWLTGYRCPTCAYIKKSGSGHPMWKGGISCEPYCQLWQDKEYKESIKERDGYKCLNPMCNKNSNKLAIHHIDYNKKNCGPDNLITLCNSCNSSANTNRKWHTAWYQALLKNRYGYRR